MNKRFTILVATIATVLTLSTATFAQLPSPSHGWNLGNTYEATWGGYTMPTQALINSVAAAGFNTIRIPCAWNYNSNSRGTINATYMANVTNTVNWCTAKGLYVIINDHWDKGWFENNSFSSYDSRLNAKLQNLWTQVANNFKNNDSHLLFACANEPNANTQAGTAVLFQYYQNWVNTVRATGGNNATRWLVVQAPSVSLDYATQWITKLPADPANHMMLECHFYDPYQFSQMISDANWGAMYYFWGAGYHVTSGPTNRNAGWGEESYIDTELAKGQALVQRGIPVFMGEWRAEPKPAESDLTGQYITQNYNSTTYWNYYFHNKANACHLYCTMWDRPGELFDWTTGAVKDQNQINAALGKSYLAPIAGL